MRPITLYIGRNGTIYFDAKPSPFYERGVIEWSGYQSFERLAMIEITEANFFNECSKASADANYYYLDW